MRWLRALLGPALALGCGPIAAPSGVVDLGATPQALRAGVRWSAGRFPARPGEYVLGWGYTAVATREDLFDRLGSIAGR